MWHQERPTQRGGAGDCGGGGGGAGKGGPSPTAGVICDANVSDMLACQQALSTAGRHGQHAACCVRCRYDKPIADCGTVQQLYEMVTMQKGATWPRPIWVAMVPVITSHVLRCAAPPALPHPAPCWACWRAAPPPLLAFPKSTCLSFRSASHAPLQACWPRASSPLRGARAASPSSQRSRSGRRSWLI
jgi:hypothetical protein